MPRRSSLTTLAALLLASSAAFAAAPAAVAAVAQPQARPAAQLSAAHLRGVHPELNGLRVTGINGGKVYLILDGKRRWIPNPATYDQLFRGWDGIRYAVDVEGITDGGQLSDGAFLAKAPDGPQVYLVTNGQKRWITSPAAMDKYYFDWRKIVSVSSVALRGFPTGSPIS
ncbi:hypothetical protein ACIHFE_16110 [Streptomyces sp. NPDC052396]|uniref:hypothetical protein n=1 Tax=Streptomyces sp. NPDC052396 TaxID=3365689 RepID=UPI0037CCF94F